MIHIKDIQAIDTKKLVTETAKLLKSEAQIVLLETDKIFQISYGKSSTVCKLIVLPLKEHRIYDKIGTCQKRMEALVVYADYRTEEIYFSQDELTREGFKNKLILIKQYGIMSDKDYTILYDVYMLTAKYGLDSTEEYFGEGVTFDQEFLIYKDSMLPIPCTSTIPQEDRDVCQYMFHQFMKCCPEGKALLLLMVQLMGLSFETIKKLPPDIRRRCLPTVLPYIFGESGSGKTTICKAFFDAYSGDRFIAVSTATEAALQKKISSVYSGVIIIDDIPHVSIGRTSRKVLDKLELILRTYGDVGAEKETACGKLAETSSWAVVTAEALFLTVESSVLRILPVEFHRGEIYFEQVESLEHHKTERDKFFQTYLKWFVSQLTLSEGKIVDIPTLSNGYYTAREEVKYSDYSYGRITDSHTQLFNFFNFISDFLSMVGISDNKIADLKTELKELLRRSAEMQTIQLYESSLPYYINKVLNEIITEGMTASYTLKACKRTEIEAKLTDTEAIAYQKDEVLIFTCPQKKRLFSMIRKEIPGNIHIKDTDIIQALISMKLLVDVESERPITQWRNDSRMTINSTTMRVYKLKLNMEDLI